MKENTQNGINNVLLLIWKLILILGYVSLRVMETTILHFVKAKNIYTMITLHFGLQVLILWDQGCSQD